MMAWVSRSRVLLTLALALAGALCVVLAGSVSAATTAITVNTDNLTITGDDGDPNAYKGVPFTASKANGVATFRIKGDLNVGSEDEVKATGPNAVSLIVGNNANIASGAKFDVSATGITPGPEAPSAPPAGEEVGATPVAATAATAARA